MTLEPQCPCGRAYLLGENYCPLCGHKREIKGDLEVPIFRGETTSKVTSCFFWDGKTYDCDFPNGPIYCGKFSYDVPLNCPLASRIAKRKMKP